jgi:hypothetical protein
MYLFMRQFTLNSHHFTSIIFLTENVTRTRLIRQRRFVYTSTEMSATEITTVAPVINEHLIEYNIFFTSLYLLYKTSDICIRIYDSYIRDPSLSLRVMTITIVTG